MKRLPLYLLCVLLFLPLGGTAQTNAVSAVRRSIIKTDFSPLPQYYQYYIVVEKRDNEAAQYSLSRKYSTGMTYSEIVKVIGAINQALKEYPIDMERVKSDTALLVRRYYASIGTAQYWEDKEQFVSYNAKKDGVEFYVSFYDTKIEKGGEEKVRQQLDFLKKVKAKIEEIKASGKY